MTKKTNGRCLSCSSYKTLTEEGLCTQCEKEFLEDGILATETSEWVKEDEVEVDCVDWLNQKKPANWN